MLKKEHIEELRNQLLEKRQKLLEETILSQNIIEELHGETSSDDLDYAEISSDTYNLSLLREKQLEELKEIDHALNKIKNSTYNVCEMCDEPVGLKRLRAKPHARYCIECRGIYEQEKIDSIMLNSPLDMHLHLRDGDMLKLVAPLTSKNFSAALIMPNLLPPITTKEALLSYKKRIKEACKDKTFEPQMTIFFQVDYSYEFLKDIKNEIIAVKLYPFGVTTNSETGVASMDVEVLRPTLSSMEELGIPLCVHGETKGFIMDREKEFLPIYESLAINFPKLKIMMEHISSKESIDLLKKYDNLYATLTVHHLLLTLDDVAGGMLNPHAFCKPIVKKPEDREALVNLVLSAHPDLATVIRTQNI